MFLASTYFSGIKYDPIVNGTELIDRGYRESFIYLVLGAIVLAVVYWLTSTASLDKLTFNIKIGIVFCIGALVAIVSTLIYCNLYAMSNAFDWGECGIIWFLVSVPATLLFFIGIAVTSYGLYEERRKTENDAQ